MFALTLHKIFSAGIFGKLRWVQFTGFHINLLRLYEPFSSPSPNPSSSSFTPFPTQSFLPEEWHCNCINKIRFVRDVLH